MTNTRNLEKIAQLTAHIRDLLENSDPRDSWTQAHGLTLMIDGLLIAEGLDVSFPDYGLEKALSEPEYEVERSSLGYETPLQELHLLFGLEAEDIALIRVHLADATNRAIEDVTDSVVLDRVTSKDHAGELDNYLEWLYNEYERPANSDEYLNNLITQRAHEQEAIHAKHEDTKEIESIIRNVE